MSRVFTNEVEQGKCLEVVATGGRIDGQVIGYAISQPWFDSDRPWNAYHFDAGRSLMWLGRYPTIEECVSMMGYT